MSILKIKKQIFIMFISMFLMSNAYSNINEELKTSKPCGTYNNTNVVKVFSWEICEQDFTYRMFYKLMPTIMDEYAIPLTGAKNLKNISNLEASKIDLYKINEYSIINIASGIISLSIMFGSVLFIWNSFLAFLRTSTDGVFLGNGYSWKSNLIKYSIILFMLLPLGNGLIVINLVVVVLILFGIAFGNAMLSVYLNFFDTSDEAVKIAPEFDDVYSLFKPEGQDKLQALRFSDHNYFNAYSYVEGLLNIQMCKNVTERFIIDSVSAGLKESYEKNKSEYKEKVSCINRPINASALAFSFVDLDEKNGYIDNDGFLSYNLANSGLHLNGDKVHFTRSIHAGYFGSKSENNCSKFEEVKKYKCGSIDIEPIYIKDNKIRKLMEETGFVEAYLSATKAIDNLGYSYSTADIESVVFDAWMNYSIKLIRKLTTKVVDGYDMSLSGEKTIKSISYYFHQQLMNDVYTGRLITTSSESNEGHKILDTSNGEGNFVHFNRRLNNVTMGLIESVCNSDTELSDSAVSFINDITGGVDADKSAHKSAFCTKFGKVNSLYAYVDKDASSSNKFFSSISEKAEFDFLNFAKFDVDTINEVNKIALNIYTDISGIERSFYSSMRNLRSGSLTSEMRKVGFFSAGSLGLKLIKSKDADSKFLSALRSSAGIKLYSDSKFIGEESISNSMNSESSFEKKLFPVLSERFSTLISHFSSHRFDLRFSNLRSATQDLINKGANSSASAEDPFETIMAMMYNPMQSFKRVMGYEEGTEFNEETMLQCAFNVNACPIPVENPIIGITDFGSELVTTSIGMMTTTIMVVFAEYISNKSYAAKLKHNKSAAISKNVDDALGRAVGGDNFWGDALSALSSIVGFASFILKTLFPLFIVMLTMGMFFAYIIPLIPYLMFQFSYIAWITMCLTIFFISPIWLIMNIKMEEDYNVSNNMYRSGYNMAMQVVFRPAILVLAMGIAWGLFNVSFLILNTTIMPLMGSLIDVGKKSFIITNVINALIVIFIYGVISVMLIKYIFNLVYTLVNKIFDSMNVENIDDQKGNIGDDVMKSALISTLVGQKGLGQISGMMGSVSQQGKSAVASAELDNKIDDGISNADAEKNSDSYSDNSSDDSSSDSSNESSSDSNNESSSDSNNASSSDSNNESSSDSSNDNNSSSKDIENVESDSNESNNDNTNSSTDYSSLISVQNNEDDDGGKV